jgi:hypothetical protein
MILLAAALLIDDQPNTFTVMLTGSKASLEKLTDAARRCGYKDAAMAALPQGTPILSLEVPTTLPPEGSRFDCVSKWMFAHPQENLGFIGNAAR